MILWQKVHSLIIMFVVICELEIVIWTIVFIWNSISLKFLSIIQLIKIHFKNIVVILTYYLYIRNYKYRRLSSTEKGSGVWHSSCDEDEEEIFRSEGTELIRLNGRGNIASKGYSSDSPSKYTTDYEQLVDRPIKHGETLTGLALKYSIPVSAEHKSFKVTWIIIDNLCIL